eukprot:GHVS01039805.1.p1 GENE.GHVS01039805.1~~GHVS01039805.1.p1  ORF type:complete len:143 (+),score=19.77 GHVS01039805.1:51-479(+)
MQVLRLLARLMQKSETLQVGASALLQSLSFVEEEGTYKGHNGERQTENALLGLYAKQGDHEQAEADLMRELREDRPSSDGKDISEEVEVFFATANQMLSEGADVKFDCYEASFALLILTDVYCTDHTSITMNVALKKLQTAS